MRSGELFAGVGGLGMAVDAVFGTTPAWFAEVDDAPSKVLAYRHPDVPNLGDVTKVDWPTTPRVQVLAGGFPCQDVSLAGRRKGMRDGTRSGLWSEYARAIDIIRPDWIVIENVRGLLSADAAGDVEPCPLCVGDNPGHVLRALGAVLGDLADLGFDAEWTGIRASDVGAPHGRFRVFILAWPREATIHAGHGSGSAEHGQQLAQGGEHRRAGEPGHVASANTDRDGLERVGRISASESDADGRGGSNEARGNGKPAASLTLLPTPIVSDGTGGPKKLEGARFAPQMREITQLLPTPRTTDMNGPGRHGEGGQDLRTVIAEEAGIEWGPYAAAISRWESSIGRPAPPPVRMDGKGGRARLNPELTEWMMGWPAGHVTDPAIGLSRAEQLKACGNGVVPQQAAAALREMLSRPGVPAMREAVAA